MFENTVRFDNFLLTALGAHLTCLVLYQLEEAYHELLQEGTTLLMKKINRCKFNRVREETKKKNQISREIYKFDTYIVKLNFWVFFIDE